MHRFWEQHEAEIKAREHEAHAARLKSQIKRRGYAGEFDRSTLARIICERDITQTALGEMNGLGVSNINAYLHGRFAPKLGTVERIAAALGIEPEELIIKE